MMYSKEDDKLLQEAIVFASERMKTCHNSKPVLVHSLRVAWALYQYGYEISVVVAAVLHDLLEDTVTTAQEIAAHFGTEVADLVSLLTMDKTLDYQECYVQNFAGMQHNHKALLIRCVDLADNARYVALAPQKMQEKVKEKQIYFYNQNKDKLSHERVWADFVKIVEE